MIKELLIGFKVVVDNNLSIKHSYKQFRFTKSKKKRIRKKYSKNNNNFKIEVINNFYKIGNTIYVNQETFEKLKTINNDIN